MRLKKKAVGGVLLLAVTSCLLLLMSSQNQDVNLEPENFQLESSLLELEEKLRKAESEVKVRNEEVVNLRMQMTEFSRVAAVKAGNSSSLRVESADKNASGPDSVVSGIITPGIHSYLPHLTDHPEHLRPAIKLSKGREGVSLVMGVPTIKRDKTSYLFKTITSLISGLNDQEEKDCVIVIFIAEPWDLDYAKNMIDNLKKSYTPQLESGLLEVIVPPAGFYPNLDNLKPTFGDTKERVKWRTKQNLDYAFLMLYARPKATYYVQMEDDVVSKPGYLTVMKTFTHQQKNDWFMLEFSALGFIGKLFKSTDLPMLVEFFLMFHADKPIDWLLDHLLWVKCCSPEKDAKHCQRMIQEVRRRFKPSLFQHIGVESSLKGKVQKLKDRDFGKAGLHRAHVNPPVQISSSMKTYQKYTLMKAYTGETFFWASTPSKNDIIDFKFNPPVQIDTYLFRSGNTDHPGDIFYNTTIEVKSKAIADTKLLKGLALRAGVTAVQDPKDGFHPVGKFDDHGLAKGELPEGLGLTETLRIHVRENMNAWVILSEIMIKENKR